MWGNFPPFFLSQVPFKSPMLTGIAEICLFFLVFVFCCAAVCQQGGEGGRSARCCPTLHCAALPGGRGEGGESQGDNLLPKMQPHTGWFFLLVRPKND